MAFTVEVVVEVPASYEEEEGSFWNAPCRNVTKWAAYAPLTVLPPPFWDVDDDASNVVEVVVVDDDVAVPPPR